MPPKQRITREMILERSFAMFCKEGMEAVNARSVAKALNCSTQPIFSYYAGMDDLKNALEQKAKETFEAAMASGAQEEPIVRLCAAYIRFAGEQPKLFAHLFLRPGEQLTESILAMVHHSELVEEEARYAAMDSGRAAALCEEMSLFAHGVAAVIASGGTVACGQERLASLCERLKK